MSPSRLRDKKLQSRRPAPRRILLAAALASVLTLPRTASAQWTLVSQLQGGSTSGAALSGSTAMSSQNGVVAIIMENADGTWSYSTPITAANVPTFPAPTSFGLNVKLMGDLAVISAVSSGEGAVSPGQGVVYVFSRVGGSWTYQQTLTAPDGFANDGFGRAVGLSVVGTPYITAHASGANAGGGALYVFGQGNGGWTFLQKLTGAQTGRVQFGYSRGISPEGMLVTVEESVTGQGFLYICPRGAGGWTCAQPITSPKGGSSGDYFGVGSVFLDNDNFVVAAQGEPPSGNVYLFTRRNGVWTGSTIAPNPAPPGAIFGYQLSSYVGSSWVLVGAPYATVGANAAQGVAYAYRYPFDGTAPQVFLDPNGRANENFASKVRISGQTIMIDSPGATGSTFMFAPTTPVGTSVTTSGPAGPTGSMSSVTFGTVATAGGTNIVIDPLCPTVPVGLLASGSNAGCVSAVVSTTAAYAGGVSVCIPMPSPAPTAPIVVQCDPNPGNRPCPIGGIDPRLAQAATDPMGNPLCCGFVTNTVTTAPGADPVCFTTTSLSLFAIGQAATTPTAPSVPALGLNGSVVAGLALLLVGSFKLRRRLVRRRVAEQ